MILFHLFIADHIDYIKNLIGVDFVGIGADYDGVKTYVLFLACIN